ncbi:hypothetical protein BC834DRAFT_880880 [Gloeopeniophorella convolvens]|nr:hypothetical protein BC834DRAFT_880880 [Gloeopeniophorella convolvens]
MPPSSTQPWVASIAQAEACGTAPRLNAFSPISLIPPELLSRIFRLLRDDYYTTPIVSWKRWPVWMRVSFVCQLWRQVALDDAVLWNRTIDPGRNMELFSELLSRSKQSPIGIIFSSPPTPEMFNTLSELLPRIQTLSLPGAGDQDPRVQELLRSKAPVLEELTLNSTRSSSTPSVFAQAPPIEYKAFDGQAPKLRKCHLDNFTIPWTHFPRCNLTHLVVTATLKSAYSQVSGSLDQLIDVLSENGPSLEVLSLRNCWPPTARAQLAQRAIVKLPRLYQLDLTGSSSCITHLFESLETPSLMDLRLHLAAKDHIEAALLPAIASATVSRFDRDDLTEFRSLELRLDPSEELAITVEVSMAGSTSTSRLHPSSPEKARLNLEFCYGSGTNRASIDVIQKLCSTLDMSELECLTVFSRISNHLSATDWVQLFQSCTGILSLELRGQGVESLLKAMILRKPQQKKRPLLFPKLDSFSTNVDDFSSIYRGGETLISETIHSMLGARMNRDLEVKYNELSGWITVRFPYLVRYVFCTRREIAD